MPELRIQQIISASQSEEKYPADNLLTAKRPWKGKAGVDFNSVILKFEKEEELRTIFIGNESSAYISVSVAKSCDTMLTFNVLIPETAFMDPGECRMERNTQRVKSFDQSKMNIGFARQKWDVIKVVCKQPYNKRLSFGLSFITFFGEEGLPIEDSPQLTKLGLQKTQLVHQSTTRTFFDDLSSQTRNSEVKNEALQKEEQEKAERMRKKQEELVEKARIARVQKRKYEGNNCESNDVIEKSNDMLMCSPTGIILNSKGKPINVPAPKQLNQSPNITSSPKIKPAMQSSSSQNNCVPSRVLQGMIDANCQTPSRKEKENDPKACIKMTPKQRKEAIHDTDLPTTSRSDELVEKRPTCELSSIQLSSSKNTKNPGAPPEPLSGVCFTLSGFENPLRGQLRDKGISLGALYVPDVTTSLTHLVCAFRNTPKAKKARSGVKLVSQNWIERCYAEKRLISEELFKL